MNRLLDTSHHGKRSSALVFTLLAVVLVTLVVLIFLSSVSANRDIESSRAHDVQADQMVRTSMDYVAGQLLQEITSSTNSTIHTTAGIPQSGTATNYSPKANLNTLPIRSVSVSITGGSGAGSFFNLIRQSIPAADTNASTDSTSVAALNGRTVGLDRWNAPMLIPGGFTDPSQFPNWIYVHRIVGPTQVTSDSSTGIIGRFAYNIYDIGDLLNVNVAGSPTAAISDTNIVAQLKATLAGADLTQLNTAVSQSDVDQLIAFRNPASSSDKNAYLAMVQASAASGFINSVATNLTSSVTYTNYYFNGRQDFLRYARTQNIDLTNAAPYLTTFSKSINEPSWGPLTNYGAGYTYQTSEDQTTSTNRFLPNVAFAASGSKSVVHYNDDGTTVTYTVNPGDPLVQHRFSLAKLSWIVHGGPANGIGFNSSLTTTQRAAAIQACFGLVWDTSPNNSDPHWPSRPDARWDYVGPIASTLSATATTIDTLNQVATGTDSNSPGTLYREPNFFELLQAGILSGSLGLSGFNPSTGSGRGWGGAGVYDDEVNHTAQILRIGANLIDQVTTDNYPTAISFTEIDQTASGASTPSTAEIWGMKDLPYLNKVVMIFYGIDTNTAEDVLAFELWNPNQPSSNTVINNGPKQFRLRLASDSITVPSQVNDPTCQIQYPEVSDPNTYAYPFAGPTNPTGILSLITDCGMLTDSTHSPFSYAADGTSSNPQVSYREPYMVRNSTTAPQFSPTVNDANDAAYQNLNVIDMGTITNMPARNIGGANLVYPGIKNAVFILEYLDSDGTTWRPYTTFEGRPDRVLTGVGGANSIANDGLSGSYQDSIMNFCHFDKTDPRTYRFDTQSPGTVVFNSTFRPDDATYNTDQYQLPSFMGGGYGNGVMARLASNNPGHPLLFYTDPDGQVRWGDDYDNNQNPYNLTNSTARPLILNRPFQSVAEMGYAFRDMPFKSLDFFSNTSADAALLDLFCVSDQPTITIGKVNLTSMPSPVQQSLSSGVNGIANPSSFAADYQTYTRNTDQSPTTNAMQNVAQLPNFIYSGTTNSFGSIYTKPAREAASRAMADPVQTRTWNLLIDVVAQVGRFPTPGATSAGNFLVEGEKHCWLSVAMDRYTGQIIDQQIEFINE